MPAFTALMRLTAARLAFLATAWLATMAGAALAQPSQDPAWPTRAGRVAAIQGQLWAFDADEGVWVAAWRNRPVAEGDLFAVSDDGRAELRIGSTVLRLDAGSELAVRELDDAHMVFELHEGALAWRVRSDAHARQSALRLPEGDIRPLTTGHFRIDRQPGDDGPAHVAAWRGRLELSGGGNLLHLDPGERVQVRVDARRGVVTTRPSRMPSDALSDWALAADADDDGAEAYRHVLPDVTGAEDLDRYGRWDRHPEFGSVWVPYAVPPGWAPFRDGRWVWLRPWGWTWADAAPWGFAPFHYGRWVRWGVRWVWWPGQRHAAAIFQPAVVAWVGGPHASVGISIGAGVRPPPPVGWVPLAPYEPFVPHVRPPPRHAHPPHGAPRPPHRHQVRPPRIVPTVPPPHQRLDHPRRDERAREDVQRDPRDRDRDRDHGPVEAPSAAPPSPPLSPRVDPKLPPRPGLPAQTRAPARELESARPATPFVAGSLSGPRPAARPAVPPVERTVERLRPRTVERGPAPPALQPAQEVRVPVPVAETAPERGVSADRGDRGRRDGAKARDAGDDEPRRRLPGSRGELYSR